MTDFDIIECGYDVADETMNFGTRCLALENNLHEVGTLATLSCSGEIEHSSPLISSVVQNNRLYLGINNSMRVFNNKECSEVIFDTNFDSFIDSYCSSFNGDYLLLCLREGTVHIFYNSEEEYINKYSRTVFENTDFIDNYFVSSFVEQTSNTKQSFIVLTRTGQVYRITVLPDFVITEECIFEFNFKVKLAALGYPFLFVNGTKMAVVNLENKMIIHSNAISLRRLFPFDYNMFLAFDFDKNLIAICPITLTCFPLKQSTIYDDILLLTDSNYVVKQILGYSDSCIQLLSYPEFSVDFSIGVKNKIELIRPEDSNDEILFISKISDGTRVTELRLQKVYETDPEKRLQRLLHKRQYNEAELFAKLFNLDLMSINKAKAQAIIDKQLCDSDDIANLIGLLDIIDDDKFKLESCLSVYFSCTNLSDVRRILNYGCKLSFKNKQFEDKEEVEDLYKTITDLIFRFDTFVAINQGLKYNTQDWERFAGCNLIKTLQFLLRNSKIDEAKIIYSRLDERTVTKMNVEDITEILSVLNNLTLQVYSPFLPVFIPISLSILPSAFPDFVKWTHNKVSNFEQRIDGDFPNNAIKFAESVIGLMKNCKNDVDISFQRQRMLHRDNFNELSQLLSALYFLKKLKNEYKITISVQCYLSGPRNVIRTLLNFEMAYEEYERFLRDFLVKYMLENHLESDKILFEGILDVMKYEEKYWVRTVGSMLKCISSVQVKLEALRRILKWAQLPWCEQVRQMALDSIEYYHPLVSEIKKEIEGEPAQIVLRKPEYKIQERRVDNINFEYVVSRVIYCNQPTMMQDIFHLCDDPKRRHKANMLLIRHFIRTGEYEKALAVLDNNSSEEILRCARELAISIESAVNEKTRVCKLRDNYYAIAKSIFSRLQSLTENTFERDYQERRLKLVQNTYDLRKNFNVVTSPHDLERKTVRDKIIEDIFETRFKDGDESVENIEGFFVICNKLASSLSMEINEIIIKSCKTVKNFNLIYTIASRLYETEMSSRNLCLIAILLLKFTATYKAEISEDSFSDSESFVLTNSSSEANEEIFLEGLKLSEKIGAKALVLAKEEDLLACMEVVHWINISFYCNTNLENPLKKLLFSERMCSSLPNHLSFHSIRVLFNSFSNFIAPYNFPQMKYITWFNDPNEILSEDKFLAEIKMVVDNLCKDGQHLLVFRMLSTIQTSLLNGRNLSCSLVSSVQTLLKKYCIPKLLVAVLGHNVVNVNFVCNLLLMCDVTDATTLIQNSLKLYKRHPRKFAMLAEVGARFYGHEITFNVADIALTTKWWNKLGKRDLNYDNFCKMSVVKRMELLIDLNYFNKELIKEYCNDYGLMIHVCYILYLRKLLENWKLVYEIKSDIFNKKYMEKKNNENDLYNECLEVIEDLDPNEVICIINEIWGSINFYYYEIFEIMLNILSKVDTKYIYCPKIKMLNFLKEYRRVSKPSETEIEEWYTVFPDTKSLDSLSEFRLPYTMTLFTDQIWNVIRFETNLKTYKSWFLAAEIIGECLNKDDICTYVVKQVVASGILSKEVNEGEWVMYPQHDDLLTEIDECVRNISNLERATSAIYHILSHTANGADKVTAAHLCYKYAVLYKNAYPNSADVEKAFIKVEKKYYHYSAMHILYTHQLADEKYLNLVTQPSQLITALYLDERILKKADSLNVHCPDINRATETLAELFGLDIHRLRYELIVDNWLASDSSLATLNLDLSIVQTTSGTDSSADNLKRAAYICCTNISFWQNVLLKIGGIESESKTDQKSISYKARALKLFAMITDVETMVQLTDTTYNEFMNYIDKLTIINSLQYLGISVDVEGLDNCSKKKLLSGLAQRGGALAVTTMATICMTYLLYDLKCWEFIINTATKFSLFDEVKDYLDYLKTPKCHHKSFYINAWQHLINHLFASLEVIEEQKLKEGLINNFLMIQTCPVLYSLNFDKIFKKCINLKKFEFAAILLQYVQGEKRSKFAKEIIKNNMNSAELFKALNALEDSGIWGIATVKGVFNEVTEAD